jgi:uncharacterized protein YhaN
MKIERIHVESFGPLTGFDTGSQALGPLVVVLGPNEAGKSTLFNFLTTALYGFQPASRDRNPHVPWGSDEAGGRIQLKLGEDSYVDVERRLRSSPMGTLTQGGKSRELRNQPLPWVEHVPRTVFRQVFAITLADLAGLDEETWARIQDRVLGSMGATDLRPARAVAETLEREASEIWRPNRRGNQLLREAQDTIRTLRSRRREALHRDRDIRALVEEREKVQLRLSEVRSERQGDRAAVERIQELLPLRRQLDRIASLRAEGGPRDQLAALPADPRAKIREFETTLEGARTQLATIEEELEERTHALARFDNRARTLLSERDRISHFLMRVTSVEHDRRRTSELHSQVTEIGFRQKTATDHLLSDESDEATTSALSALSVDLLKDRVERLEAARLEQRVGEDAPDAEVVSPALERWGPASLLVTIGVGLTAWGLFGGPVLASSAGAALLAAGATLAYLRLREEKSTPTESGTGEGNARAVATLEREISELLTGIPVRDDYLAPPGPPLVAGLERLQALLHEGQEAAHSLEQTTARIEVVEAEAGAVASALGREGTCRAEDLAHQLERDLRDAERAQDAAGTAQREADGLTRTLESRRTELQEVLEHLSKLTAILDAVDDPTGAGPSGVEAAQKRLEAHMRADQLEDELARAHPDLAELKAKLHLASQQGGAWTRDEQDLSERKARLEAFEAQIEELVETAEALGRDAAHLRELETLDVVDSEIETLEEIKSRLTTERDKKWVLAQLVREADRRFREEHQPDLIRRASSYLEHLTGGRYDRLLVDEQGDGDLFQLMGPGLPAPIPLAPPISTGTLEQAYLSLRLAIVDHLDQGEERLPLFIDEAFVNWDDERRDRGLEVLANLSASRQVFTFTCHPEMADRLQAHGGRVLRLDGNA